MLTMYIFQPALSPRLECITVPSYAYASSPRLCTSKLSFLQVLRGAALHPQPKFRSKVRRPFITTLSTASQRFEAPTRLLGSDQRYRSARAGIRCSAARWISNERSAFIDCIHTSGRLQASSRL